MAACSLCLALLCPAIAALILRSPLLVSFEPLGGRKATYLWVQNVSIIVLHYVVARMGIIRGGLLTVVGS